MSKSPGTSGHHPAQKKWNALFLHGSALSTSLLIVFHQSIIALSSYFLTRLIELLQHGDRYEPYLFLYLGSMLIPYVPGCMSYITLQHWINHAHREFIHGISSAAYGLTGKFRDGALRESVVSVASRNSFIIIKEYLSFVHDFLSFTLNSVLSMLVLGFLLPGRLWIGYAVSVMLCSGIVLFMRKRIAVRAAGVEHRLINYGDKLSSLWENATLGNRLHFRNWSHQQKKSAGDAYYRESDQLQRLMQTGNVILALAALGPSIYLVVSAMREPAVQPALLAAIVANLTRIFHILNSLNSLLSQLLEWPSMNARINVMSGILQQLRSDAPLPEQSVSEMTLNGESIVGYTSVVATLAQHQHGRFTIKGANGSGKSTLLLFLKKEFGENAIMLPVHQEALCWHAGNSRLSSGQRMMLQLEELIGATTCTYLLLDEWDANLDAINSRKMDQFLDEISADRVVIEIRH